MEAGSSLSPAQPVSADASSANTSNAGAASAGRASTMCASPSRASRASASRASAGRIKVATRITAGGPPPLRERQVVVTGQGARQAARTL
jgi:hypothetical protein